MKNIEIIDGKDLVNMKFIKTEDGLLKEYKPKDKFIPKYNENYCFINDYGDITWLQNCDMERDRYIYSHKLVFRTRKECEDYKWFLNKLDEYKTDFTRKEWGNTNIKKYEITICHKDRRIKTGIVYSHQTFNPYFFTKENADKFIEEVGEEHIKKYMFNIWE